MICPLPNLHVINYLILGKMASKAQTIQIYSVAHSKDFLREQDILLSEVCPALERWGSQHCAGNVDLNLELTNIEWVSKFGIFLTRGV